MLLIIIAVAGLYSLRNIVSTERHALPSADILTADSEAVESFTYALNRLKNPTQEPTLVKPNAKEIQMFLSQLRSLSHKPQLFSQAVQSRLDASSTAQIFERTLLLQEAYVVLNIAAKSNLKQILISEQKWFAVNHKEIADKRALHNHIQEIVKLAIRTSENSQQSLAELKKIAQPLKKSSFALRSFRFAMVANSEWDITDIFENIPHDLKLYVQGSR